MGTERDDRRTERVERGRRLPRDDARLAKADEDELAVPLIRRAEDRQAALELRRTRREQVARWRLSPPGRLHSARRPSARPEPVRQVAESVLTACQSQRTADSKTSRPCCVHNRSSPRTLRCFSTRCPELRRTFTSPSGSSDQERKPPRALAHRFEATPPREAAQRPAKTLTRSDRSGAPNARFRNVGKACVFGSVAALVRFAARKF